MGNTLEPCKTECKFCVIHQYGVFVLNIGGLLILILILIIYWRDVIDFFKRVPQQVQQLRSPRNDRPTSPVLKGSSPVGVDNYLIQANNDAPVALMAQNYGQQPVILQPQTPTILPLAAPVSPPTIMISQAPPTLGAKTSQTTSSGPYNRTQQSIKTQTNQPANPNQFRLPTPKSEDLNAHESTGSTYYREMMMGKQPVASISQYLLLRKIKKTKRGAKNADTKKHHHHHHHHNKTTKK